MLKVKLKDVVMRVKEKVDKDDTDLEYYVGGEHIDGNEICVSRRGVIQGSTIGPAFHMAFKAGDVLLMSRNPHLRKASMVDFDGICSDVSYICRTKDESVLLQSFLPFLMQTNDFWRFAEENKKGGLPFFLNWSDFERYEFELPPIEKQRELSQLLWAMQRTKQAYQNLLAKSDELVKSQFIELFGDSISNSKSLPIKQLSELASSRLGKMLDAKKQTGKHRHPYLANFNVQWFYFDFSTLNQMDFDEADQIEFSLENGDLMVCEGGEVGRCAIWRGEIKHCYFQKAVHRVRCNIRQVLPEYLAWWFKFHSDYNGFADIVGSKATIAHLPGVKLKKLEIPVPNIEDQERFVRFIEQLDKSKYVAYQLTLFLNKLIKYKLQSLFQEECICSLKM